METKSINSCTNDARQKLDFLDVSFEKDNLTNEDRQQNLDKDSVLCEGQSSSYAESPSASMLSDTNGTANTVNLPESNLKNKTGTYNIF